MLHRCSCCLSTDSGSTYYGRCSCCSSTGATWLPGYHPSQVQLLLEHGADPTAAEGGTPLVTEAAQQGHGAVAGLLEAQAALLTMATLLTTYY